MTTANVPTAAAVLRNLVVTLLCTTGHETLAQTARLLTSEIVTNVYRHTATRVVHVEVTVDERQTWVYVHDDKPRYRPMPPEVADGEGGLGLFIVDECADAWGITHYGAQVPTSKAVWFRLVEGGRGSS
ncbi:ATP-binding protein [Streptomyces sp. MZ04]|uniref:ATP-binding protein n=1 Tax=Streptomyces sp. MZ04 TaxID=2559236 RepID=UPI001432CF9F|nr:ATP-binding protein [Streptomyces sp. MZ04]